MTQKIEFDALRYCRANAGRMGRWRGQDVAGLLAAEVEQLRAELTTARGELLAAVARASDLEGELAALRDAARPVVEDWRTERSRATDVDAGTDVGYVVATFEQLDALAALVGEG